MPNHTTVHLDIVGPQAAVLHFVATANGSIPSQTDEEGKLDFAKILPMPEELNGIGSPANIVSQFEIDDARLKYLALTPEERQFHDTWHGTGIHKHGITASTSKDLIDKYGANNWYDWKLANWGTKWNAYSVGSWEYNEIQADPSLPFRAGISFQTAWTPPTTFIVTASKQYKGVTFYLFYSDEGGFFVGSQTITAGVITNVEEPDWYSKAGIEIREMLGTVNTYPDEYEIRGRLEYLSEHPEDAMDNQELADLQMLQAQLENKEGEDE